MVSSFSRTLMAGAVLATISSAQAATITFDEPGYIAGSLPPSPWAEETGSTSGWGVNNWGKGGTQALGVDYGNFVSYTLPSALNSSAGPQTISVLFDPGPGRDDPYNFLSYGGMAVGNGSLSQVTGSKAGIFFRKAGSGNYGMYAGSGSESYLGAFAPSAATNFYEITFEVNAAWDNIRIGAGPEGGSALTMDCAWDGSPIEKVWLSWGDTTWVGQVAIYDNLTVVPEPAALAFALGALGLCLRRPGTSARGRGRRS